MITMLLSVIKLLLIANTFELNSIFLLGFFNWFWINVIFSNVDFCNLYNAWICLLCLISIVSIDLSQVLLDETHYLLAVGLLVVGLLVAGAIFSIFDLITGIPQLKLPAKTSPKSYDKFQQDFNMSLI